MVIKIGFSIMVSLIMAFWVYNAAPQTRQQHFFYDEGGKPHQKKNQIHTCGPFRLNKSSGLLLGLNALPSPSNEKGIGAHYCRGVEWQKCRRNIV